MPGPAIRAWNLAAVLAEHLDVVLASTVAVDGSHPNAELALAYGPALRQIVDDAEVCFAPSALVYMSEELRTTPKPVAVDIYDPYHLENLEMHGVGRPEHDRSVTRQAGVLNAALRRGDYFTCASERQRDFWLGSLAALGRVNPFTYANDPLLAELIGIVPYGLPLEPPTRLGPGARGVIPGVGAADKVVLWGGGVYNWLDPVSVVKAVERLRRRVVDVRLVFLGMHHPNPALPPMRVAQEVRALSDGLGLTGRHVFFNPGWVPYERRADYLLDADVAVSTHFDHIETRYSFRSRVLDYLWARLPMVLTGGDVLAEEVRQAGVGLTVPAADDAAIAEALERILSHPPPKESFKSLIERHSWQRVAAPLVEFCLHPRRAPDLLEERLSPEEAAV